MDAGSIPAISTKCLDSSMERATGYEPGGCEFKSCSRHHKIHRKEIVMSYDVSIYSQEDLEEVGWTNITFNVAPMLKLAFENEAGIKVIDNLTAKDSLPKVCSALQNMLLNKEMYIPLNPENDWGSYESTLKALAEICVNLTKVEKGIVEVGY